ncbi:MAG TPA: alkyl hydroperoxide reductase, partial [Microbacteriaceae bacterium]|nr:alkyl hydroperoxide reductase [Microbacteriaceae bacterium]
GSIMDVDTGAIRLAFSGQVAPNAVPTTLVMDRQGRVAARISGILSDPELLASIIEDTLSEEVSP